LNIWPTLPIIVWFREPRVPHEISKTKAAWP
jgi:hypothetical protein